MHDYSFALLCFSVNIMTVLGSILLTVAAFLLGLKSRPPVTVMAAPQPIPIMEKPSPEQALGVLDDQFRRGMITAQAYQAQRAEIMRMP